jgi:hypothetical protein
LESAAGRRRLQNAPDLLHRLRVISAVGSIERFRGGRVHRRLTARASGIRAGSRVRCFSGVALSVWHGPAEEIAWANDGQPSLSSGTVVAPVGTPVFPVQPSTREKPGPGASHGVPRLLRDFGAPYHTIRGNQVKIALKEGTVESSCPSPD